MQGRLQHLCTTSFVMYFKIHLSPPLQNTRVQKPGRQEETLSRLARFRRTKPERLTGPLEDVVDSSGSHSSRSRRNRAVWAAHSEGSAERAGFEQGPSFSESQSPADDRHHHYYHRETCNFLSFSRTFVVSIKYEKIVATFVFYANIGPVVAVDVSFSHKIYWCIEFFFLLICDT